MSHDHDEKDAKGERTACADCGRTLTAEEKHYYGVTCETCEGNAYNFETSEKGGNAHGTSSPSATGSSPAHALTVGRDTETNAPDDLGTKIAKAFFKQRWDEAAQRKGTDQAVTPEYLDWLQTQARREGFAGNEVWNAAAAWARSDTARIVAERDALVEAGRMLSNMAFNLSQRKGDTISQEWADSLRKGWQTWDELRARSTQPDAGEQP